ncbi:hypothetical protein ADUPG1_007334, partial [Aduncisulcus paluster]
KVKRKTQKRDEKGAYSKHKQHSRGHDHEYYRSEYIFPTPKDEEREERSEKTDLRSSLSKNRTIEKKPEQIIASYDDVYDVLGQGIYREDAISQLLSSRQTSSKIRFPPAPTSSSSSSNNYNNSHLNSKNSKNISSKQSTHIPSSSISSAKLRSKYYKSKKKDDREFMTGPDCSHNPGDTIYSRYIPNLVDRKEYSQPSKQYHLKYPPIRHSDTPDTSETTSIFSDKEEIEKEEESLLDQEYDQITGITALHPQNTGLSGNQTALSQDQTTLSQDQTSTSSSSSSSVIPPNKGQQDDTATFSDPVDIDSIFRHQSLHQQKIDDIQTLYRIVKKIMQKEQKKDDEKRRLASSRNHHHKRKHSSSRSTKVKKEQKLLDPEVRERKRLEQSIFRESTCPDPSQVMKSTMIFNPKATKQIAGKRSSSRGPVGNGNSCRDSQDLFLAQSVFEK